MINIGIFGATGYTGYELIKILHRHPHVNITFATSHSYVGQCLTDIFPAAPAIPLIAAEDAPLDQTQLLFLCLPHATAATTAVTALNANNCVIDLSADFRLKDAALYAHWYQHQHPAPHLLSQAVYGLTEFAREQLPQTRLVANPGCYTTTSLLALQPLMQAQIKTSGAIIIDAKSGVSGAGRAPQANTHFVQVADNFAPYKIGRNHRHLPEMEQVLGWWHKSPPKLIFSPHLLPVPRGILANLYIPLTQQWREADLHQLYTNTYANEPFIQILPLGQLATLAHVTYTNRCTISLTLVDDTLIITSATDNLIKGAAGQAVQNMNVMLGFAETTALI